MILPSLRKTTRFLRTSAACATLVQAAIIGSAFALPAYSVQANIAVSDSVRQGYAKEFAAGFPAGSNHTNASKAAFEGAVQNVILAHPAAEAPAIAYTLTCIVGVDRAEEVAVAIAKLFDKHPELRERAREIGLAMNGALQEFIAPVASGDGKGVIPIGEGQEARDRVDQVMTNVLGILSDGLGVDNGAYLFPRGVQPGEILSHETPVINL